MSENTEGLIFSAGMDTGAFTAAADKAIASLKTWEKTEQDLSKSIAEKENQLKQTTAQIDAMNKKLAEAGKATGTSSAETKRLADAVKILQLQNTNLNKTISDQKTQLAAAAQAVLKMKQAYDAAVASAKNLETAGGNVGKNLSGAPLFAKLGQIKDKIKNAFSEISQTFAGGGGITDALGGTIGKLGVYGAVAVGAIKAITVVLEEFYKEETEVERQTRLTADGMAGLASGVAKATIEVDRVKNSFELAAAGVISKKEALDLYNETLGKVLGVTRDFNEAEEQTIKNAETYIRILGQKAKIDALYKVKEEVLTKQGRAQANIGGTEIPTAAQFVIGLNAIDQYLTGQADSPIEAFKKERENTRKRRNLAEAAGLEKDITAVNELLDEANKELAGLIEPFKDKAKSFDKAAKTGRAEVVNIYERELRKLAADIAAANTKAFTDKASITVQVAAEMKERSDAYADAVKKGALTRPQAAALNRALGELEKLILDKRITDFETRRAEYLQNINDLIDANRANATTKRIEAIEDDFDRERAAIDNEFNKLTAATIAARDKKLAAIDKDAAANGLRGPELEALKKDVTDSYEGLLDTLAAIRSRRQQELAFRAFEAGTEEYRRALDAEKVAIDEAAATQAQAQNDLFAAGKISYEQYQKAITDILKKAARERAILERAEAEKQIAARIGLLIGDDNLTPKQRKQLTDEMTKLRERVAQLDTEAAKGSDNPEADDRIAKQIQRINGYAQALSGLINNVVAFWAAANEAESRALERSIALQEKRVDAARRVAEKGTAEYLRLEEERLRDLELKRENAARRQLAINAVMQSSQILTAVIGGIAQGIQTGGPLGAIIGLAAVVGAIASGIALAKSLAPQTPSFFVGTEDTGPAGRRGKPVDNKGGFYSVLHPNERVLTAEQNKKLKGLSNDQLVALATANRYGTAPLPGMNYGLFSEAIALNASEKIRLAESIEKGNTALIENNELHRRTHRYLKNMGYSVKMDREGLAISLLEATKEAEIKKRV
jgi:hypothetical protein